MIEPRADRLSLPEVAAKMKHLNNVGPTRTHPVEKSTGSVTGPVVHEQQAVPRFGSEFEQRLKPEARRLVEARHHRYRFDW